MTNSRLLRVIAEEVILNEDTKFFYRKGRKEIRKGRYLSLRTSRLNFAYFAVEKILLYHKEKFNFVFLCTKINI
jgi:hypothetical protein